MDERLTAWLISRTEGTIAFRNVSFAYNTNYPVLRAISLEVATGIRK